MCDITPRLKSIEGKKERLRAAIKSIGEKEVDVSTPGAYIDKVDRLDFNEDDIEVFKDFFNRLYINNYKFYDSLLEFVIRGLKFGVTKLKYGDKDIYREIFIHLLMDGYYRDDMEMNDFLKFLEKKIRYVQKVDQNNPAIGQTFDT